MSLLSDSKKDQEFAYAELLSPNSRSLLRIPKSEKYQELMSRIPETTARSLFGIIQNNERQFSYNENFQGQVVSIQNDNQALKFKITVLDTSSTNQIDDEEESRPYRVYTVTTNRDGNFNIDGVAHRTLSRSELKISEGKSPLQIITTPIECSWLNKSDEFDTTFIDDLIGDLEFAQDQAKINMAFEHYLIDHKKYETSLIEMREQVKELKKILNTRKNQISDEALEAIKQITNSFEELKNQYYDFKYAISDHYADMLSETNSQQDLSKQMNDIAIEFYSLINKERNLSSLNSPDNLESKTELLYKISLAQVDLSQHIESCRSEYKKIVDGVRSLENYYSQIDIDIPPKEEKEFYHLLHSKVITLDLLKRLDEIAGKHQLFNRHRIDRLGQDLYNLEGDNKNSLEKLKEEYSWIPEVDINIADVHPEKYITALENISNHSTTLFRNYQTMWNLLKRAATSYSDNVANLVEYFNNILIDPKISTKIKNEMKAKITAIDYFTLADNKFVFNDKKYKADAASRNRATIPDSNSIDDSFKKLTEKIAAINLQIKNTNMDKVIDNNLKAYVDKAIGTELHEPLNDYYESQLNIRKLLQNLTMKVDIIEKDSELASRLKPELQLLKEKIQNLISLPLNENTEKYIKYIVNYEKLKSDSELGIQQIHKTISDHFKLLEDTVSASIKEFLKNKDPKKLQDKYAFALNKLSEMKSEPDNQKKISCINDIITKYYKLAKNDTLSYKLRESLIQLTKKHSELQNIFSVKDKRLEYNADASLIKKELDIKSELAHHKNEIIDDISKTAKINTSAIEWDKNIENQISGTQLELSEIKQIRRDIEANLTLIKSEQNNINDQAERYLQTNISKDYQENIALAIKNLAENNQQLNAIINNIETVKEELNSPTVTFARVKELKNILYDATPNNKKSKDINADRKFQSAEDSLIVLRSIVNYARDVTQGPALHEKQLSDGHNRILFLMRTLILEGLPYWETQIDKPTKLDKCKVSYNGNTYYVPDRIKILADSLIQAALHPSQKSPKEQVLQILGNTFLTQPTQMTANISLSTIGAYKIFELMSQYDLNDLAVLKKFNQVLSNKVQVMLDSNIPPPQREPTTDAQFKKLYTAMKEIVFDQLETWKQDGGSPTLTYKGKQYNLPPQIQKIAEAFNEVEKTPDLTSKKKIEILLEKVQMKPTANIISGFFSKSPEPVTPKTDLPSQLHTIITALDRTDLATAANVEYFRTLFEGLKMKMDYDNSKPAHKASNLRT